MELEEWEYLSENNLLNSSLVHEEEEERIDVEVKEETKEITEVHFQGLEEDIQRSTKVEIEEEEEENLEVQSVRSVESNGTKGLNVSNWKWRFRGIGAVRSVTVTIAAATLSILILGGCKRNQNRELQLQIYADDKRIKQVAMKATKLNQGLSAVRVSPTVAANISFGGYYQGLNDCM